MRKKSSEVFFDSTSIVADRVDGAVFIALETIRELYKKGNLFKSQIKEIDAITHTPAVDLKLQRIKRQKEILLLQQRIGFLESEVVRLEADKKQMLRLRYVIKELPRAIDRMIMHHISKLNKKRVVVYKDDYTRTVGSVVKKNALTKIIRLSDLENYYDKQPENTLAFKVVSAPYLITKKLVKFTYKCARGWVQK